MTSSLPLKVGFCLAVVSTALLRTGASAQPGAGNEEAIQLASGSPLVRSAERHLLRQTERLQNANLRSATLDALNSRTCVRHRANLSETDKDAIVETLRKQGLFSQADADAFPGGAKAGVFPPILDEGSDCPHLPQTFFSAPGSVYGGHHSFPGGLVVHETFNNISDQNLAAGYRRVYGTTRRDGLPMIGRGDEHPDIYIDEDVIVAAPIWHDWAKMIVFQWNSDGSEFPEFNFGGNGQSDDSGSPGDSRTGGHHMISVAEAMSRGLAPDFVIAQTSAHSTPTSGNEYKVVNWLRAAAIIAGIDPVKEGYLRLDSAGRCRLPALRRLGDIDLNELSPTQTNVLAEYVLHNLSDADFTLTGPAVTIVQFVLRELAPYFGYDPLQTSQYNWMYRNPALTYLSGERLLIIYGERGLDGVRAELAKLRDRKII
jgi:hypothetical protein